jgi:hypothetical protein
MEIMEGNKNSNLVVNSNSSSKTLSKAGLYAPLSAFDSISTKPKKVPSSLKDGALIDFLFCLGQDYNRKSSIRVGKNNGCKPVSHNEISHRIRQRALTLVGGGINTAIAPHRSKVLNSYRFKRKKKKRPHEKRRLTTAEVPAWDTLEQVNRIWNTEYLPRLLVDQAIVSCDKAKGSVEELFSTGKVEFVGSQVRISACKSHASYIDKAGYLIGDTTKTWRIATVCKGKKHIKVLVAPKSGTGIEIILPSEFVDGTESEKLRVAINYR